MAESAADVDNGLVQLLSRNLELAHPEWGSVPAVFQIHQHTEDKTYIISARSTHGPIFCCHCTDHVLMRKINDAMQEEAARAMTTPEILM